MNSASKTLNLVHGWGLGQPVWMPMLAYLGGWTEVRRMDLPGYGSRELNSASLSAWAEELASESTPDAVWVGSSLGGLVAAEVARNHPEKVAGLITIGASPCFVSRPGWPHGVPESEFEGFEQDAGKDPGQCLHRFLALATKGSMTLRDDLRHLRALNEQTPPPSTSTLLAGLEILRRTDAREHWLALQCPCLHIIPEHDALVPASILQFHQGSPANQQTSLLGSSSHLPWLGRPRPVAELINTWAGGICQ